MAQEQNSKSSTLALKITRSRKAYKELREHMRDAAPFQELATITELSEAYKLDDDIIYYHAVHDHFYNEKMGGVIIVSRRSFDNWHSNYFQREPLYPEPKTCYACGTALSTDTSE